MKARIVQLAAIVLVFAAGAPAISGQRRAAKKARPPRQAVAKKPPAPPSLPCGDHLGFQVLLDRQGFSSGEIDGKPGPNLSHAIAAMRQARHLSDGDQLDCDAWHALGGDDAEPTTTAYTLSDADVDGPFEKEIPREIADQAKLAALTYRSPLERISEMFHAAPALIQRLNPAMKFEAGATITVPAVAAFDATIRPALDPAAGDVTIEVTRTDSALRVLRSDGSLALFAPVTTGSTHDPLPIGDWKVLGSQWHPKFHYNPDLFWDADPKDGKATIQPGPNNPVGVVWIALNKPHYGLHGTPEPGHIGHVASHGCVRLTNWDAARLVSMVKPGTPVAFR